PATSLEGLQLPASGLPGFHPQAGLPLKESADVTRPWMLLVPLLLLPWSALAQIPAEGVPLEVRRGFYVETDVGALFTVGGHNGVSNTQTFLQLGLGVDLGRHLELGAHFGLGASADTCFAPVDPAGFCTASENFTLSFLGLSAAWRFELVPRLSLAPTLFAGSTL